MNDEENVKTDMCDGQVTLKGDNDGNAIKLITIIFYVLTGYDSPTCRFL